MDSDDARERVPAPVRERVPASVRKRLLALASVTRLGQFASVGAVGAVCDNLVLAALVETGVLAPVPAAVLAKEASITVMFVLNEVWTFSEATASGGGVVRRFLTSNVVRSGGAVVGIAVLYVLHSWFGVWYLLANVVGIGVGFALNYTAETLVTWRVHRA